MAQNRRRRRRAQPAAARRANGQAQSTRQTQNRSPGSGGTRARSGYQERTIAFEVPTQSAQQARTDNSIEFPAQQARRGSAQAARRQSTAGAPNGRLRPTAANMRDPARREKRKKRRLTRAEMRRRRLLRRLTAFLTLLCVIAAGVYLTVTMLFKINSIQVQTEDGTTVAEASGYSSEQILQALGVQLEDNIFSFDPDEKAEALEKVFPLLERIRVVRKYPTGVVVRVTEAVPTWAMQTEEGWLTISSTLKIMTLSAEQPALPTLYGGEPASTAAGEQLAFAEIPAAAASEEAEGASAAASASGEAEQQEENNRLDSLNTLLTALQNRGMLADTTRIEFADTEQMAFVYQNRISVLLGTLNELDYKMDFAQYLLFNSDGKGCAATDTGELDCSHVRSDGTLRPIFAQGAPTLPSGYDVTTQPVAEPVPAEDTAAEEAAPAEDAAPTEDAAPAEEAVPAEGTPAEQATPAEDAAPAEPAAQ